MNSVYLVKDLFVIHDVLNHKLLFIDTEGNNVKTIDNVYNMYVNGVDIVFSLNDYVPRSDEVYEHHIINEKKITYLGNFEFSDMESMNMLFHFTTPNGCEDYYSRCTLYDNGNLKIEAEDMLNNVYINNNLIHIDNYSVNEIKLLDQDYVFLNYLSNDIGYNSKALIVDKNGDVITDFDDYIVDDTIKNSFSLSDGIITYTVNHILDGIILSCSSDNYIKNGHTYDSVVFYEYSYKYIGNGRIVDNGVSTMTFRELIKAQTNFDNCEDVLDAWYNGINVYDN